MTTTNNLLMPFLEAAQSQKHVTVNEALRLLDIAVQLAVVDKDLSTPPGAPSTGARYIVGNSATGAWLGHDGEIAAWVDGAWIFMEPLEGWLAYANDENILYKYTGSAWVDAVNSADPGKAVGSNGNYTAVGVVDETLSGLAGASVSTSVAFPGPCIILGASTRVITNITGASSFDVGDGSTVDRFGAGVGITAGVTNVGYLASPAFEATNLQVTLTANGSNFTGGAVRVSMHYLKLGAPTT